MAGGAYAAKIRSNSSRMALGFASAPDSAYQMAEGRNYRRDVTLPASDGTNTDTQAIAVTVTNVNDNPPVITSDGGNAAAAVNVAENSTAVTTVTAKIGRASRRARG